MFVGPPGVGKVLAATQFVKALNCVGNGGDACDKCANCRSIDKGEFPDFYVPAKQNRRIIKGTSASDEDKLFLGQIVSRLHYAPVMGRYKAVLLEPAETLTDEAGSMLLKVMEEPPPKTVFLLVSTTESSVMPTLVSRCQKVRFTPLSEQDVTDFLVNERGVPEPLARGLAAASEGSIERAEELNSKGALNQKLEVVDFLVSLFDASLPERVDRSGRMLSLLGDVERKAAETIGTIAGLLARDIMLASSGMDKSRLLLAERADQILDVASRVQTQGALKLCAVAAEFHRGLGRNENPRNLLHYLGNSLAGIGGMGCRTENTG